MLMFPKLAKQYKHNQQQTARNCVPIEYIRFLDISAYVNYQQIPTTGHEVLKLTFNVQAKYY